MISRRLTVPGSPLSCGNMSYIIGKMSDQLLNSLSYLPKSHRSLFTARQFTKISGNGVCRRLIVSSHIRHISKPHLSLSHSMRISLIGNMSPKLLFHPNNILAGSKSIGSNFHRYFLPIGNRNNKIKLCQKLGIVALCGNNLPRAVLNNRKKHIAVIVIITFKPCKQPDLP